jgi:hypothetical protein
MRRLHQADRSTNLDLTEINRQGAENAKAKKNNSRLWPQNPTSLLMILSITNGERKTRVGSWRTPPSWRLVLSDQG